MRSKEEIAVYDAAYREEHKEKIAAYREEHKEEMAAYREEHKEKIAAYRKDHKEEIAVKKTAYRKDHKEEIAVQHAAYQKTDKGKMITAKQNAKRRHSLGFLPINKPFGGAHGHHVNREVVLYIPKALHTTFPHNVFTGAGMDEINFAAFAWLGERR